MSMQRWLESLSLEHFAIIYIDQDGSIRRCVSESVAESHQTILSPLMIEEFLRAVASSSSIVIPESSCKPLMAGAARINSALTWNI
jgi:hypothetical protein